MTSDVYHDILKQQVIDDDHKQKRAVKDTKTQAQLNKAERQTIRPILAKIKHLKPLFN